MKWTNRIITGLVIVLLSLIVLLLIGVMFYNSDKKMEIGSLTDWISSLSTFCTLVVACMAYKKAPDWIKQKVDENSLVIATKIICESYPSVLDSIKEIEEPFISSGYRAFLNSKIGCESLLKQVKRVDKTAWELFKKVRELENELILLERHGWDLIPSCKILNNSFSKEIYEYESVYFSNKTRITSLLLDNEGKDDYISNMIHTSSEEILIYTGKLKTIINDFLSSQKKVQSFFTNIK
ncbi:Uncharacterised protein [Serratia liquefaciens]|nr:Uncharacterised protein [Serratia liquefaciens]